MDRYLKNHTFYKLQSQSIIDNADQQIVDYLSSFTGTTLSFSLTLFNVAVDLISFSNILYGIYPPQEKHETLLEIENLILKTPSESTLIRDLSLAIKQKDNLLIRKKLSPYH